MKGPVTLVHRQPVSMCREEGSSLLHLTVLLFFSAVKLLPGWGGPLHSVVSAVQDGSQSCECLAARDLQDVVPLAGSCS